MGLFKKISTWIKKENKPADAAPSVQSPDPEEILQKIEIYKRKTWMPVIDEAAGEILASKIGGRAYIPAGESHPACSNCGEELTLFLQLRPQDLPHNCDLDLDPDKLIQLFYCTTENPNCEAECDAWAPFSKSVLARSIEIPTQLPDPSPVHAGERQFHEKSIVDWIENEDYPDWQEMQMGDAQLTEKEVEVLETSENGTPKAADKLGGWPYWVQGVEYPVCAECGIQMQMIFQLDSNHNLPYMFGDSGIGHLHQCRLHKNILAFGWAGY